MRKGSRGGRERGVRRVSVYVHMCVGGRGGREREV